MNPLPLSPLLRNTLVALAVLLPGAVAAAQRAGEAKDTYLAYLLDEHVGSWEAGNDGGGYRETLRISAIQGEGRTRIVESFAMVPEGTGWRWERRLRAGTVSRLERGTLAGGRLSREGEGGPTVLADVPADTVLPAQRIALVRAYAAGNTARDTFGYLDPSLLRVLPARLQPCERDAALGAEAHCIAWQVDGTGVERWHVAAGGRVLRIDTTFGGLPLRLDACAADCDRVVVHPFDMIGSLTVDSPYRISRRLAQGKLRYLLVRADGQPPVLAHTGEQSAIAGARRTVVTVCRSCGEAAAETPESLAPYLRANPWVRSDDVLVRRMARSGGPQDRSVAARMAKLTNTVRLRMREDADYIGYADAVQALRTGRGDCTEFAVLLAALARAQGIPARLAAGMAYSSRFQGRTDTFNPHVWVQVYDTGRWVSYDAALEGFDATHIAFAVGTGEPQEVFDAFLQLRQLRIEKLGAVVR
jgi:hypothetical protein